MKYLGSNDIFEVLSASIITPYGEVEEGTIGSINRRSLLTEKVDIT